MYESARVPMKPRDIRRRAYSLMRQCWTTLLIAAILMCLFGCVGAVVEAHGKRLATNAYNAQMEIYHAEKPTLPYEDDNAMLDDLLNQHRIERMAQDAYDDAYAPWEWLGYGIDLIDLLFSCVIAVRLSQGLLTALRGGECSPQCLRSGWARTSTTCWLAIQITLRILGWSLLPMIVPILFLGALGALGDWATLISMALVLLVAGWASLHYALSRFHLADDTSRQRTASACLRLAVDDADAFGLWNMCKVLLPAIALMLLSIAINVVGVLIPAVSFPAAILVGLADLLCLGMKYACFACIYDEMRQRAIAPIESPGLTRARALSDNQDA